MSWRYLAGDADFLLSEVDASQWIDDFAYDVITGEAVEGEDDEVECDRSQLVHIDAVERKDLIVDRIQRLTEHAGLHLEEARKGLIA